MAADFVVSSSACSTKVIFTVIPRDGLLSEAKIIRYFGRMGSHYGDFRPHALKVNNCNYSNQKHGVMFEIRFHAWQNLQWKLYIPNIINTDYIFLPHTLNCMDLSLFLPKKYILKPKLTFVSVLCFIIYFIPKLYIPSTRSIDLIQWHTQLIVCA